MDELLKLTVDDIKHQIELIKINKKACAILERQIAHYGSSVPTHIQMDFDNRQAEIKRLMNVVVELTKKMPSTGTKELSDHLEEEMPERIIISDSSNVLINTRIDAGRDVIILHIASSE